MAVIGIEQNVVKTVLRRIRTHSLPQVMDPSAPDACRTVNYLGSNGAAYSAAKALSQTRPDSIFHSALDRVRSLLRFDVNTAIIPRRRNVKRFYATE